MFRFLSCGALLAAVSTALAAPPPDPADPTAPVPELRPRTALSAYRRLADDPPLPWREANQRVTRIGGWRSYLREAQAPEPAASGAAR